jgi:hypothetical protein
MQRPANANNAKEVAKAKNTEQASPTKTNKKQTAAAAAADSSNSNA